MCVAAELRVRLVEITSNSPLLSGMMKTRARANKVKGCSRVDRKARSQFEGLVWRTVTDKRTAAVNELRSGRETESGVRR